MAANGEAHKPMGSVTFRTGSVVLILETGSAVKLTLKISIMVAKASYRPSSPKMPPHRELHHKCLEAHARAA